MIKIVLPDKSMIELCMEVATASVADSDVRRVHTVGASAQDCLMFQPTVVAIDLSSMAEEPDVQSCMTTGFVNAG